MKIFMGRPELSLAEWNAWLDFRLSQDEKNESPEDKKIRLQRIQDRKRL